MWFRKWLIQKLMNFTQQKTHLCKWVSENNDLQDNQYVRLVVRSGDYGAMPTAAATLSPSEQVGLRHANGVNHQDTNTLHLQDTLVHRLQLQCLDKVEPSH